MRDIGPPGLDANRITPLRFQAPPKGTPFGVVNVVDEPPSMSILFNRPAAKNPMERPSGDQNGRVPRSVPRSGRAAGESSERSHSCDRPSDEPTKTIFDPSGEIATAGSVV